MTTRCQATNSDVDWTEVELATEVRRTYLVRDANGREFFKMYKPSEAGRIFQRKKWTGKIVSTLDRSKLRRKL